MIRLAAIVLIALWVFQAGGTACCQSCDDPAHCVTAVACQACAVHGVAPTVPPLPLARTAVFDVPYLAGIIRPIRTEIWRPPTAAHCLLDVPLSVST